MFGAPIDMYHKGPIPAATGLRLVVEAEKTETGRVITAKTETGRVITAISRKKATPATPAVSLNGKIDEHRNTVMIIVAVIALAAIAGGIAGAYFGHATHSQMVHIGQAMKMHAQNAGKWLSNHKLAVLGTSAGIAAITALVLSRHALLRACFRNTPYVN